MLGSVTKGPVLPAFQLLKDAGFEGVELISPNQLDLKEVLAARDKTGLVIHGVSGGRHWQDPLSDPDPKVVERGMAAIQQEFLDCKAYGGTTVLVVPAVVNKKVSYRDAYTRSQENIRKLIPYAEQSGVKIAIEEVWNKFLLSPVEFARYIDEFGSPTVGAYFDVGNIVEYGFPEEWIRELGKRILKIHIKEYAKPKRFDYKLGEGRDRLAGRAPGARRRRLRRLDLRRGRLRRPGRNEGRGPADEPGTATPMRPICVAAQRYTELSSGLLASNSPEACQADTRPQDLPRHLDLGPAHPPVQDPASPASLRLPSCAARIKAKGRRPRLSIPGVGEKMLQAQGQSPRSRVRKPAAAEAFVRSGPESPESYRQFNLVRAIV